MSEQFVTILIRLSFAAVAAVAVGLAPVTWAQEVSGDNKIDLTNLLFLDDKSYSVTYEDSVSREATNQTTVRKIGYGQTSIVNIVTTSSGVYSSDAMTDPHIRYPGIHVEQVPLADEDGHYHHHWPVKGSFVSITRTPNTLVIQGNRGTCVVRRGASSAMLMC
jgi:hypothetical protein